MKVKIVSIIAAIVFTNVINAQDPQPPASKIMEEAYKQASKQKKNVMVIFHASWCGWCKKLDASINDPACKDFFDKSYIITHLTIMESKEKKNLENPGAQEIFESNGGAGQGIPYFLIFDKNGKLLSDSKMIPAGAAPDAKPTNIGCPASDEEVAAFVEILKKTSKITDKEISAISARFKQNRN